MQQSASPITDKATRCVLIPGLGANSDEWAAMENSTPTGVITKIAAAVDPQMPDSAPSTSNLTSLAQYYDGIDRAIIALGKRPCVLIGHSLGCVAAAAYTRYGRYRHLIDGQVLLAPLIFRQIECFRRPLVYGLNHPAGMVQALYFAAIGAFAWPDKIRLRVLRSRRCRRLLFAPLDRDAALIPYQLAITISSPRSRAVAGRQLRHGRDYLALEWIPRPIVPTCYLEGWRDRLGSAQDAAEVRRLTGQSVTLVPDSGHWLHMEAAPEVWARIDKFIDELPLRKE
jgi:pimeloyl-ACP methyl ester carboxylesterase